MNYVHQQFSELLVHIEAETETGGDIKVLKWPTFHEMH